MISLRVPVDPPPIDAPLVVRLVGDPSSISSEGDALLVLEDEGVRHYDFQGFSLVVKAPPTENMEGDVLLLLPGQRSAHRLIRASSPHNTLLVTEQCDQICVMCSQPPKKFHADLVDHFADALLLAPQAATIGISGGEPLLHKTRLFGMLTEVAIARPDLVFHILTNAQHFTPEDIGPIADLGPERVLWGVPVYSSDSATHDAIVGKPGAFERLMAGLGILARAGASVELRTVVLRQNWDGLPQLADYVTARLGFCAFWAIMQLEPIGYGRMNWKASFKDTAADFANVARAIDIAEARGMPVSLYNFPLCSVPVAYRENAPSTISDWKRKYLEFCGDCSARSTCGGFFEWYSHAEGFKRLGAI